MTFLKKNMEFSLRERKRSEAMVAEEYCWAIAQAEGRYCCVRLDSGVLEFGFQLVSVAYNFICI